MSMLSLRSIVFPVCLGLELFCIAQNVVPNPSFEEYTVCPDDLAQIENAVGWSTFWGSADYYNVCSGNSLTGIPANAFGYQAAYIGDAYIGCYTYKNGPIYREYAQAQLITPLTPGVPVHLSMSVSAGGFGTSAAHSIQRASSGIGMRFSTQAASPGILITDQAVLYMEQVLQDTASWVVLSSMFVPDSAYAYVQIGNFFSDELTDVALLDQDALTDGAYAFVDAVCVSESDGVCLAANGLADITDLIPPVNVRQVGNALVLDVAAEAPPVVEILLFDGPGRLIQREKMACKGQCRLPLEQLTSGLYYLQAWNSAGTVYCSKVFLNFP